MKTSPSPANLGVADLGEYPFAFLVRFARVTALLGAAWTACCIVLVVGWELKSWLAGGSWPALQISFIMRRMGNDQGAVYFPASAGKLERHHQLDLVGALLELPAIVPLLIATVLIALFYLWLGRIERGYPADR